jgi:hypothetical protein
MTVYEIVMANFPAKKSSRRTQTKSVTQQIAPYVTNFTEQSISWEAKGTYPPK